MSIKYLTPRTKEEITQYENSIVCENCGKAGKEKHDIRKIYWWHLTEPIKIMNICKWCRKTMEDKYIII